MFNFVSIASPIELIIEAFKDKISTSTKTIRNNHINLPTNNQNYVVNTLINVTIYWLVYVYWNYQCNYVLVTIDLLSLSMLSVY